MELGSGLFNLIKTKQVPYRSSLNIASSSRRQARAYYQTDRKIIVLVKVQTNELRELHVEAIL